ncbi:hypothetical protein [Dyadobacter chenhuakuii]|uniref:Uncharacterized protein n=1 Tax=Dyadobacter chenhuakuii TaxID=2909339 RepID=A0A9X1TWS7_9BACT|nr:hypothetical protein [Dyadobacter chenhuakuii]MCF2501698.1 hypothetical protein [Dyadobacter chenhuakuii]
MQNREQLDVYEACIQSWDEVIKSLKESKFSYQLQEIYRYNTDGMDSEMAQHYKPTVEDVGMDVIGCYNGYTSVFLFEEDLRKKMSQFKDNFFHYIDSNIYSTSERLNSIYEFSNTIEALKSQLFKVWQDLTLHRNAEYEGEGFRDGWFVSAQYEDLILQYVVKFVNVQFGMFQQITTLITTSVNFVPGRLDPYDSAEPETKLNFNLSRAELVQLLLEFRKNHIIGTISDASLAKFAENYFSVNHDPLKAIKTYLSQLKSLDKTGDVAKNAVFAKLRKFLL